MSALDLTEFRARVQHDLDAQLRRQRGVLEELGPEIVDLVDQCEQLLRGGKRLRAAFCHWGYVAAGGRHDEAIGRVAAAMEMFQAAALLHDDVMDDSQRRRGLPTTHVALADRHAQAGWPGDPARFGLAGAILAGNLCLVWCDEMVTHSGLPAHELERAQTVFDRMRSQLMGGQYLDMLIAARGWSGLDAAARIETSRRVVRFKSAQYSVSQPLLIGARAAGVSEGDAELLTTYGLALGEAFQMRDDLLGVFGDPQATGKPAGDDLREGKRTVLLAMTLRDAAPEQAARLEERVGDPDLDETTIEQLRTIIADSGAPERLEELIDADTALARESLAATTGLTDEGHDALAALIGLATARDT